MTRSVDMAPAAASQPSLLEVCYAYVGIVYYDQGIISALRVARGAEAFKAGGSDIVSTFTQFGILAVLLVLVAVRSRPFAILARDMLPYVVIVGLCTASTLWSDNPMPTLRRAASLGTCVGFGLYLQQAFGLERMIVMVGRSAVGLGVLSVAVYVGIPPIGRETAEGYESAIRGVFPQKNPMAECMLLGISCVAYSLSGPRIRRRDLLALAILLVCILLTRSATSAVIAMLVLVVAGFMAPRRHWRWQLIALVLTAWVSVVVVVMLSVAPDSLFALAGRDASLTGRGPLWLLVLDQVAERPWWGHGYAGFWNEDSTVVQYLWLRAGWRPPDSHNGYLDIVVQIGLVGLLCYIWLWYRVTRLAILATRRRAVPGSRWVLLFMTINFVLNLDEGPLPFADEFTMMMPGALVALSSWGRAERLREVQHRWQPRRPIWPSAASRP